MGSGWAYPFFSLFIFWLLIDVCHTVFITVKYVFFVILGMLDKGLRFFFFVPCSRQDAKEKNLLFLCRAQKFQSFLFKFYNIRSENLVLDQLTISLLMFFFIPITCLLDIVRNFYNSNIFFCLVGNVGQENIFSSQGLRIFSLSHAWDKMEKRKICFSFTKLKNYNLSYPNFVIFVWRIWSRVN